MDMNMDVKDLFAALKKKSGSKKKDTRGGSSFEERYARREFFRQLF